MEQLDHCRHQRLALNERSPSLRSDPDDPCNDDRRDRRSVAKTIRALLARAPRRRAHNPFVTQVREQVLGDRIVAFAAGSRALPAGELNQSAQLRPRGGVIVRGGGSLVGGGPFVRRLAPWPDVTLTRRAGKSWADPHRSRGTGSRPRLRQA
jgi:hypothetical protein